MNSLVKVFSNFKDFYSEINGATLTGAIDVIVVEQPDGEFQCSPFHVRFGKLGVLRSREKVVDIEINGEPVDIHMKLGESGEAFFVEECLEEDIEELPENLATSPIPTDYYPAKYADAESEVQETSEDKIINVNDDILLPLPLPRRNSIDLSKDINKEEIETKFENQVSDFSHRRHTDNALDRRNLSDKLKEYTTQKIRQEWAEHEDLFQLDNVEKNKEWVNSTLKTDEQIAQPATTEETDKQIDEESGKLTKEAPVTKDTIPPPNENLSKQDATNNATVKEESKSKKKRRKKSQMKKKNAQRKSSSSSSMGSTTPLDTIGTDPDNASLTNNTNSSNDESPASKTDETPTKSEVMKTAETAPIPDTKSTPNRIPDLDIHFFSDTEAAASPPRGSRPSTPVQSDSELEIAQQREKGNGSEIANSASWKWGELPTPSDGQIDAPQAQRNSMLSGMFSFMKKTNKIRKTSNDGGVYLSELDAEGMDPEMAAMYFPSIKDSSLVTNEDDRESGNGTSLPHSPSSMEGPKSLDSDYDDGKSPTDNKYLDFVAMSMCGGMEKGGPSNEEFDQNLIKHSDVCQNPSLFSSPNLVVRLNGKYYSWAAACPIVMTIITFQKPLSDDAIEQLMNISKLEESANKMGSEHPEDKQTVETKRNYSWWYWRRSGAGAGANRSNTVNNGGAGEDGMVDGKLEKSLDIIDGDQAAVGTQTSRPNTPDISENTFSKTEDSTLNADNTSAILEGDELSQNTLDKSKNEKFKKSLRLSSAAIKQLNLKAGMNEIEFSVTTAYQGTTRCKCYLFRWKHSDKVVISDIDGTITKSDVLGHILPMVGKDWAQLGVAQLFSKIEENGYKLLYLSARAIGQSRATREYLRSIRQGDVQLPDGPLLLNPTSLISAFHREVIERKPEQFKIACLSDIQALFPENPFYAGYGNRINDVWAYRAVGIPIMRIFTINTKGELKHELTQTFQSSYCSMTYIVDQLFPPIKDDEGSVEFSNFNYWRDPLPDLDIQLGVPSVTTQSISSSTNVTSSPQSKMLSTIPEN